MRASAAYRSGAVGRKTRKVAGMSKSSTSGKSSSTLSDDFKRSTTLFATGGAIRRFGLYLAPFLLAIGEAVEADGELSLKSPLADIAAVFGSGDSLVDKVSFSGFDVGEGLFLPPLALGARGSLAKTGSCSV